MIVDIGGVAPARIGGGIGYIVGGMLCLALAAFAAFAASGGAGGAAGAAAAFSALGLGLVAIGFWIRLFGLLERRLIDIQLVLLSAPKQSTPTP
jgi:hypothetical protein